TPDDLFIITIVTRVNDQGQPPGGTNTVTLTSTSIDGNVTNNTSGATTRIVENADNFELPDTGFTPGITTVLPPQTVTYFEYSDLWLEIPSLGVEMPIVGIPLTSSGWDVSWLWDSAGYLNSTAFPTWQGNTGIAGHVTLPTGLPGPFANLGQLQWGDQIIIHAWGLKYIYEVRSVEKVSPQNMSVLGHQEYDWVTLITCSNYTEFLDEYQKRLVAQAVLVKIESDSAAQSSSTGH
ncbi:MAG: sortase, partial [Anaerolineae bacterium]|nr:sortase [Anaerolineae bacterium]